MDDAEEMIDEALEEISDCVDESTKAIVKELLACGEAGVALEVFCSQLLEFDIAIPSRVKELLEVAARKMGLEIEEIRSLKST